MKILLKNATINGLIQNLLTDHETISYIGKNLPECDTEFDLTGMTILPGVIDPHTHIRDLNQTEKEDWTSASQAALRGGTTMVFDMPNNRPPTVNLEFLNLKREKAKLATVNYRFNVAATQQNLPQLKEILDTRSVDVAAIKLFLAGSNSNEYVDEPETLNRIFELSVQYQKTLIVHAEIQKCVEKHTAIYPDANIHLHNKIRNRECAIKATELMIALAKKFGNKVYIAHTSTAEEIDLIQNAKKQASIFCEITPHHLLLSEEILEKTGNYGKVNPPIRSKSDNQRLMLGIQQGVVDTIGTDHAPHTLHEKNKPYAEAPSGFPGLETSLSLLLNEVNKGNFSLERLIDLTSYNATQIFDIPLRGRLKEGYFADLAIVDLQKNRTIKAENFFSKAKYSPYEGRSLKGDVLMTFVNGKLLYNVLSK